MLCTMLFSPSIRQLSLACRNIIRQNIIRHSSSSSSSTSTSTSTTSTTSTTPTTPTPSKTPTPNQSSKDLEDVGQDDEDNIYDREFADMSVEDFASCYADDTTGEIKQKVEIILREYEYAKYNSMGRVPSIIDCVDMQRLIQEGTTPYTRSGLFHYLFKKEMEKRATRIRKEKLRKESLAKREAKAIKFGMMHGTKRSGLQADNGDIIYGLWHNSLFCRIPDNKLKTGASSSRLIQAAMFGRKLIFDFDFEDYMVPWTYRNAIDQIQEAYGLNRFHYKDPFDIWFCNFRDESFGAKYCREKAMKNLDSGSMITIKNDCFTNHFDKSRLVYLSPNAREPLGKICKSDDIYIIGVYNDKGNQQPITYRKALKLGIRAKCLPIDSHLAWQGSSKSLCVNHVTGILLEVIANGGDWKAALMRHIPSRKIKPMEVVVEEEERRLSRWRESNKMSKFSIRHDLE